MLVVAIPGAKYTSGEAPGEGRTHFAALTGTDYTSLDLSGGSYQLSGTDGSTFNLSASAQTAIAAGAITVKTVASRADSAQA